MDWEGDLEDSLRTSLAAVTPGAGSGITRRVVAAGGVNARGRAYIKAAVSVIDRSAVMRVGDDAAAVGPAWMMIVLLMPDMTVAPIGVMMRGVALLLGLAVRPVGRGVDRAHHGH